MHAPSFPTVAADFQLQAHGDCLCSMQRAVHQEKRKAERQQTDSKTYQGD